MTNQLIEFTISDENNMTWLTVRDLDVEVTEMIGIHFKSHTDQCWVDGTAILADKLELCNFVKEEAFTSTWNQQYQNTTH